MTIDSLPRFILNPLLRRMARLHQTPLSRYQVRVARTPREYEEAFRLVHAVYVYQGYESVRAAPVRMTPHHLLPESTVLVAYEGEQLVGTMTVTADSAAGLPIDKEFPNEVAGLRGPTTRLVEFGALAVVERCWHSGVTTLLNMAAYHLASKHLGATHIVADMVPRGAAYFRAVYGFKPLGNLRRMHCVSATSGVAIVLDVDDVPGFFGRYHQGKMATGRSVATHFIDTPLSCVNLSAAATVTGAPIGLSVYRRCA